MSRVVPFFLIFMLPAMLIFGVERGGLWPLAPLLFTFGMVPLLDAVLAQDRDNPDESEGHSRLFDVPILAWVPVQLAMTGYVLWRVTLGSEAGAFGGGELGAVEIAGALLSLGVLNGAGGINIAHELVHRKSGLHRAAAEILMTSVSYTHFCVEHVLGHHRFVSTPQDPATSRLGETVYRFYPRTVFGGMRSAWRLETERCARRGIAWTSLRDRRTRYLLELALVYLGVGLVLGPLGLALFIVQGVIAFSMLEGINYVEHYGLVRRRLASGKYERVRPQHSWNSAHRVSNYYLFNLARHSDHHYLASREYDRLRHHEDAPQLPTGYAGMFILALCPPAWFRVMDHRVEAWNARHGAAQTQAEAEAAPPGLAA